MAPSNLIVAQTQSKARNKALDVLRGVAVMMVVFSHVVLISKADAGRSVFKYVRLFFSFLTVGGWSGVDLFFVLSGFLVSGLLINEFKKSQTIQPGRFLIRRGFKIYPGFIVFILLTFLIETVGANFSGARFSQNDYIKDLFFIHNYFGGRWDHSWSLDVEEAFYFLLTGLFIILTRSKNLTFRTLINTYFFLVIIGVLGRLLANYYYPETNYDVHFHFTHFRLEALFFGVILSYLYHFKKEALFGFFEKYKALIIMVTSILILPNFIFHRQFNRWESVVLLSTNPIAYGLLIILAIRSKNTFFNNRLLSFIGRSSYAIYLWHPFINIYVSHYFNTSKSHFLIYIFIYAVISVCVGYMLTKIVEEPLLKLRDRLYPSKNIAPIPSASTG